MPKRPSFIFVTNSNYVSLLNTLGPRVERWNRHHHRSAAMHIKIVARDQLDNAKSWIAYGAQSF